METGGKIKKGTEVELVIESLAFGGKGIARLNDKVVFVKDAIPGQTVLSRITKNRSAYLEARALEICEQTKDFISPQCDHFMDCGGCTFQNLDYTEQLQHKEKQVFDLFTRMGGFSEITVDPIVRSDTVFQYRNKMEFTFSNRRWILKENDSGENPDFALGLHIPGRHDKILDIDRCCIQSDISNKILVMVKSECISNGLEPYDIKNHSGFLRHLMLRTGQNSGEIMINFVTSYEKPELLQPIAEKIIQQFSQVKSVVNNINTRKADIAFGEWEVLLTGRHFIVEKLGRFEFEISANSFFQTNSLQTEKLYGIIQDAGEFAGDEVVYDLYCGTGSISIFISQSVKQIYGFELVESAIENALKNAERNTIENVRFFCGDLIHSLQDNNEIPTPDVVIIDPPRAGMHKNTVKDILKLSPGKIVYCSCNPATQVRDVRIFCDNGYKIKMIQPVDMFPHTPHIECVAALEKSNEK